MCAHHDPVTLRGGQGSPCHSLGQWSSEILSPEGKKRIKIKQSNTCPNLKGELPDDADDHLVDGGVAANLQEAVGLQLGLQEGDEGRAL